MSASLILSAIGTCTGICLLALRLCKYLSDRSRRKNRAVVALVKGYAGIPNRGGYQYHAVRVTNDGERPFSIVQIGFYGRDKKKGYAPIEAGNANAKYSGVLAPGEHVEVRLERAICMHPSARQPFRAFCRIATCEEFLSKPIREDSSGLFPFIYAYQT